MAFLFKKRKAFIMGIAFATITLAPYVTACASQGSKWRFSGFLFNLEDGNSYTAKLMLGSESAGLFHSPYTTLPHPGSPVYLPYLFLGKLAGAFNSHDCLILLFHTSRAVSIVLLALAYYDFLAFFVNSESLCTWGAVLSLGGGGLGWVLPILGKNEWLGSLPLDFISPESFGFLALLLLPHLTLARALLLWTIIGYLKGGGWRWGVVALVMSLFNPLEAITLWVVVIAYGLVEIIRRRPVNNPMPLFLFPAPVIFYLTFLALTHPFYRVWNAQINVRAPHPGHYLLAYGWIIPLAAIGALKMAKRPSGSLPVIWAALTPLLVYLPTTSQRRLAEGVWVALIALALQAFKSRERWAVLWSGPLLITPALILAWSFKVALNPSPPVFLPVEKVEAFEALRNLAKPGDGVIASYPTGNALPAWVPVKVPLGHGAESYLYSLWEERVKTFFSTETSPDFRLELMRTARIRWVFWGPEERATGGWFPGSMPGLCERFSSANYSIWELCH